MNLVGDKRNVHQKWWDKKVLFGITRQGWMWTILCAMLLAWYFYGMNWDYVFGLRVPIHH